MKSILFTLITIANSWVAFTCPLISLQEIESSHRPQTEELVVTVQKTGAAGQSDADMVGIRTGYAGHYSCRVFTGLDKELAIAVSDEEPEEVRRWIAAGANVEAVSHGKYTQGMTMLQVAAWYGWSAEAVELLIGAGANVNATDSRGNTVLIYATQCQPVNLPLIELLIRARTDVNGKDSKGMTPLMYAALGDDSTATIDRLLKAGARVSETDNAGWTALMHATQRKEEHPEIVAMLIEAGANVNAIHRYGGNALASAALNGQTQVVRMLLEAGARANTQDNAGWTPLLCAAQGGHACIVEQLLEAGADVNTPDQLGRTPMVLAIANKHEETADLLRKAGGK